MGDSSFQIPGLHSAQVLVRSHTDSPTFTVRLQFDAGRPPSSLISALEQIGFRHGPAPIHDTIDPRAVYVLDMASHGTADTATPTESARALADLAGVFADFGIPFTPRHAAPYERL